jgi:hypothetical protein
MVDGRTSTLAIVATTPATAMRTGRSGSSFRLQVNAGMKVREMQMKGEKVRDNAQDMSVNEGVRHE